MFVNLPSIRLTLPVIHRFVCICRTMAATTHSFYKLTPIKWGFMEATGISLQTDPPQNVIDQIRRDVHEYRVVVFSHQGDISGKRHVEISKWFGELDSTFYRHPASPDLDVFRVSNDDQEGCRGVGRTGWHVDGSFQPAPFAYSLYHIVKVPDQGDTVFAPLTELIEALPSEQRQRWERLWMVSDRRVGRIHPLLYPHPITGKRTMCFHLGMTEGFIWDYGTSGERWTDWQESVKILKEIHHEFVKDNGSIQYSHKWQAGDFIIADNIAVGHEASPQTQLPVSEVGLRVMHRTTVKGIYPPAKSYSHQLPLQSVIGSGDSIEGKKDEL